MGSRSRQIGINLLEIVVFGMVKKRGSRIQVGNRTRRVEGSDAGLFLFVGEGCIKKYKFLASQITMD